VRLLELRVLRGPSPAPGFDGLRAALVATRLEDATRARLDALLDALEAALGNFASLPRHGALRPAADLLDDHLAAAERLANTPSLEGGLRLYAQAEGEALARHLAGLRPAMDEMAPLSPGRMAALFEVRARARHHARRPRVARPREAHHPHVEILGLIEARLLDFDCVVLGALDESVWPQAADPGPWMSRPMRRAFGLPSPELRIGRVAADFLTVACAGRHVTLSRAARRGGSPTVPARWLTRLSTFLRGQAKGHSSGLSLPLSHAPAWAAALDRPEGGARPPSARPSPRPPRPARTASPSATWAR
jgi:ATP-dependent helicase/nuclease subunit B